MLYDLRGGLSWGIFHVHLRRTCILLSFDRMSYKWQLCLIDSVVQVFHMLPVFYPLALLTVESGALNSPSVIAEFKKKNKNFSFQFCYLLLHTLWSSVIRCIHINNYYAFWMTLSLYHYVMSFFIPSNFHCSDIYFVC